MSLLAKFPIPFIFPKLLTYLTTEASSDEAPKVLTSISFIGELLTDGP